ncbi:MAG: hypothetical protein Q9227_009184 [Pyrenula ochraceoflavens]
MNEELVYQPLRRDGEEIRLLDLQPATRSGDTLRCTIRHAKLHKSEYVALSYVWGQQTKNKSVIEISYKRNLVEYIESKLHHDRAPVTYTIEIGNSLSAALRCLRQKNTVVTIWADALSINQSDKGEKSWQVPLMKLIYSKARMVHAWLGPCHDEDNRVISNVRAAFNLATTVWDLAKKIQNTQSLAFEENWLEACFTVANTDTNNLQQLSSQIERGWANFSARLCHAVISNSSLQSRIVAVKALSHVTYFTRVWILQEIGRARDLMFNYGQCRMSYQPIFLLLSLANALHNTQYVPKVLTGGRDYDKRFLNCLAARTTCGQNRSLRKVLEVAYFETPPLHQAGDLRDLVYARLGLASSSEGIEVDYRQSFQEVYVKTARFLLTQGFLEPLVTFRPYKFLKGIAADDLPSWAYDWSAKGLDAFSKYNASRDKSPQVSFIEYPSSRFGYALTLTGVKVGQIQSVGKRFSTTIQAAGFRREAIAIGRLQGQPLPRSAEQKQMLKASINRAYEQLGLEASKADIEELFGDYLLPLASFWSWWLHWIIEIRTLTTSFCAPQVMQAPSKSIAELLFRNLKGPSIEGSFRSMTDPSALTDLQRWSTMLFEKDDENMNKIQAKRMSALAVALLESIFRSAWGMRPAMLDTGRLSYIPEDGALQDQIVIFHGVKAPLVIRKSASDTYRIIGPTHVCGVMQGQLMDANLPSQRYVLV